MIYLILALAGLGRLSRSTSALSSNTISLWAKIRLLNAIVIPTATHASETWKLKANIKWQLNGFHQHCRWRILWILYRDSIINEEVYRHTLSQSGPVCWTTASAPSPTIPTSKSGDDVDPGQDRNRVPKRPGRSKKTWRNTFIKDLNAVEISWDEVTPLDRVHWRSLVAQCAARRRRNKV